MPGVVDCFPRGYHMYTSILCWVLCLLPGADQGLDKPTLLGLLEAAYAPLQDLTCEYEGKMTYPQGPVPKLTDSNGLYDDFSGAFAERRDGAVLVDIYHRFHPNDHAITRETLAMINGRCEHYTRMVDERTGSGQIESAHFTRPEIMGSLAKIVCDTILIGLLRHDDWDMRQEESEVIDGCQCLVLTFIYKRDPAVTRRFWIDLQRGGHALKSEFMVGKAVDSRVFDIVLDRFQDAQGQEVWIPVSGIWEAYVSIDKPGQVSYGTEATNRETYTVLRESVRVNTHLKDDRFSVKYRSGTLITDTLRRVQFEFGQTAPPDKKVKNRAEVEAALKEQLRLAQAQGDELKASSWERSGSSWLDWMPWLAVGCSLVLIAGILIRRHVA